ncbi:MAG: PilT/PilU family type 4a pilus ATPase [Candidatus Nealsonbacteria bacterium]|nr:PilT/PilU family type 4a pilus ATPase [Candidatus Nealsonbacteria bacterium]
MVSYQQLLKKYLETTARKEASDLHISVGYSPMIRVNDALFAMPGEPKLTPRDTQGLCLALMTLEQQEKFLREKEIDFSYAFENNFRFRVNIFFQRGFISAALRFIPTTIRTINELGLPQIIHNFTEINQGFVLVTGPASHGKSTTLAALIDEINQKRCDHIVTIEDPIEYIFKGGNSVIEQREVNSDTCSFSAALKSIFRQDPDVIMIGEMRDLETVGTAITAAETGHLVFATLHTNSAAQTIHRIVDSFPAEQQNQIRAQISVCLMGVISQRLLPKIGGGLVPACEVMFNNSATANLIRENKIHEIPMIIETSAKTGMISLNKSLAQLVKNKLVALDTAFSYSSNPHELEILI